MVDAFDFILDEYICFGGYPGAAPLIRDLGEWRRYVAYSIIAPVFGRDILETSLVWPSPLMRPEPCPGADDHPRLPMGGGHLPTWRMAQIDGMFAEVQSPVAAGGKVDRSDGAAAQQTASRVDLTQYDQ